MSNPFQSTLRFLRSRRSKAVVAPLVTALVAMGPRPAHALAQRWRLPAIDVRSVSCVYRSVSRAVAASAAATPTPSPAFTTRPAVLMHYDGGKVDEDREYCKTPATLLDAVTKAACAQAGAQGSTCRATVERDPDATPVLHIHATAAAAGDCRYVFGAILWTELAPHTLGEFDLVAHGWIRLVCGPQRSVFIVPNGDAASALFHTSAALENVLDGCKSVAPRDTARTGAPPLRSR